MTSISGKSTPIYEDGTIVSVELADGESVTVPAGETWVVSASLAQSSNTSRGSVNGTSFLVSDGSGGASADTVFESGDVIDVFNGEMYIGGWSV